MSDRNRLANGGRFHRRYFHELEGFARGINSAIAQAPRVHGGDGSMGDSAVDKVRAAQEKRARKAAKAAELAQRSKPK